MASQQLLFSENSSSYRLTITEVTMPAVNARAFYAKDWQEGIERAKGTARRS